MGECGTYLCELKERLRISAEISNVKHCLRTRKIRIVNGQSSVNAVSRPKIRNSTRNGDLQKCSSHLTNRS